MLKSTLVSAFLLAALAYEPVNRSNAAVNPQYANCTEKKDSLTGKMICSSIDELAINKGGIQKIYNAFGGIKINSIPKGATTKFTIAFIVDTDGSISGERVIRDEVGGIGDQMIKIVKSFEWSPAMCKGKKVASLYTIPLQICLQ